MLLFITQYTNWCCCDGAYTVVGSPQTWNRSNTKYVIYPFFHQPRLFFGRCVRWQIFSVHFFSSRFECLHNSFWNAALPLLSTLIGDNVNVCIEKHFAFKFDRYFFSLCGMVWIKVPWALDIFRAFIRIFLNFSRKLLRKLPFLNRINLSKCINMKWTLNKSENVFTVTSLSDL